MCEKSDERTSAHVFGEVKSAAKLVMRHEAPFDSGGNAGCVISVKVMLPTVGSCARLAASAWPMNPPAPVMRTFDLVVLVPPMLILDVVVSRVEEALYRVPIRLIPRHPYA